EDHLRILRYFRFQARFGSGPADTEAEEACSELAPTLKGLSRERIGMEMLNLLGLPDPAPTVARMAELGVLQVVLPEADVAALAALVAEEKRQSVAADPIRRLAAMLPADLSLAQLMASRFRLSGAQKKRLVLAAGRRGEPLPVRQGVGVEHVLQREISPGRLPPPPTPSPEREGEQAARALAYRLGMDAALDRLLLAGADIAPIKGWAIPTFPLKGGEIVARGVKAGPDVARTLREIEDRWVAEGFADGERVSQLLDEKLASRSAGND
ncbi:MAG: hypothetical protein ACKOPO_02495, partial [Novosphingobium sp.]